MEPWINTVLACVGGALLLIFGAFAWTAAKTRERRAAFLGVGTALLVSLPFFLALLLPLSTRVAMLGSTALLGLVIVILLALPIGRVPVKVEVPRSRFDERDIVFARANLVPGTEQYETYYARRPTLKELDEKIRELPGLFSLGGKYVDPMSVAAARASFQFIKGIRYLVDGDFVPRDEALALALADLSPQEMSDWIKDLARFYGAHSVGITELRPYHLYSHIGRGAGEYGAPIELPHRYAIAITTEMNPILVQQSPASTESMETAKRYVEVAKIAFQLTYLLRLLGYSARAHIDENYRVICPLVARDAGLGEIGRFSFLITPDLGPRVRIAVVTTDAPLAPDQYVPDPSVIDFCTFCTKCAENCPAQAVPMGERQEHDGALRWRIDANACFRYWNIAGTDCGRCMATCPYSHPALYGSRPVRWLVRHSGFARRAFLRLDDLFYGRKPRPHQPQRQPVQTSISDSTLQGQNGNWY